MKLINDLIPIIFLSISAFGVSIVLGFVAYIGISHSLCRHLNEYTVPQQLEMKLNAET